MTSSENRLIAQILAFAAILFMSACSWQRQESNKEKNASAFLVEDLRLVSSVDFIEDSSDEFMTRKAFNLTAKVFDALSLEVIQNENFTIASGTEYTATRATLHGVLNWRQSLHFDRTGSEGFVPLDIDFSGDGYYSGILSLRLMINPWTDEIIDLRYQDVPENSGGLDGKASPSQEAGKLYVSTIGVSTIKNSVKNGRMQSSLQVELTPTVQRRRLNGGLTYEQIDSMDFQLEVLIVDQGLNLLAETRSPARAKTRNGDLLISDVTLVWTRLPELNQKIKYLFRLTPVSGRLQPWAGEAELNSKGVSGSVSANTVTITAANYQDLKEAAETFVPAEAQLSAGFYFSDIRVDHIKTSQPILPDGLAQSEFQLTVCLKDALTQETIRSRAFSLGLSPDEASEPPYSQPILSSSYDGCLRSPLTHKIPFDYLSSETSYLSYRLQIRSENEQYAGQTAAATLYINPWLAEDAQYFWDDSYGRPTDSFQTDQPSIHLSAAAYSFTSAPQNHSEANIDAALSLTHTEFFQLRLQPQIRRQYSGQVESMLRDFPAGTRFQIKMLFAGVDPRNTVDQAFDPSRMRYISGFETQAEMSVDGDLFVKGLIAFDFDERPLLESGLILFAELRLPDQPEMRPALIEIPFDFVSDGDSVDVENPLNPLATADDALPLVELEKRMLSGIHQLQPVKISQRLATLMNRNGKQEVFKLLKPRLKSGGSPFSRFVDSDRLQSNTVIADIGNPSAILPAFADRAASEAVLRSDLDLNAAATRKFVAGFCDEYKDYLVKDIGEPETLVAGNAISGFLRSMFDLDRVAEKLKLRPFKNLYKDCGKDPYRYLKVDQLSFFDNIESVKPQQHEAAESISFSASVSTSMSSGYSESSSTSTDFGVKLKLLDGSFGFELFGIGLTSGIGVTTGFSTSASKSFSESTSKGMSYAISQGTRLNVEHFQYALTGVGKQCLHIAPKPALLAVYCQGNQKVCQNASDLSFARKYLICKDSALESEEHWYYLTDSSNFLYVPKRIQRRLDERFWISQMRGRDLYRDFVRNIQDESQRFLLRSAPTMAAGLTSLSDQAAGGTAGEIEGKQELGLFPGLVFRSSDNIEPLQFKESETTEKKNLMQGGLTLFHRCETFDNYGSVILYFTAPADFKPKWGNKVPIYAVWHQLFSNGKGQWRPHYEANFLGPADPALCGDEFIPEGAGCYQANLSLFLNTAEKGICESVNHCREESPYATPVNLESSGFSRPTPSCK